MKHKLLMTTLGAVVCLWLATAQAATPNPQFLGTWEVDLSKTQPMPPPGPSPKSVTVTVKDAGGGKWTTEIVTEMPDGTKQTRQQLPVMVDGSTTPISGNGGMDHAVVTWPDPSTAVVTFLKDGKVVQTETSKLSADGKQMLHTVDATRPDGSAFHETEVLNKK
jgi:hypothetical protein